MSIDNLKNILEHPLVDTIATFLKKFKSSKSYWSISSIVILFTLREALVWRWGSSIEAYAQRQLGTDYGWLWTAIEFVFGIGGSWELVLLGISYFGILSYVKVNSVEKDEIVKVVKEESNKTHDKLDELMELFKIHGISEKDFLEKYFGKNYAIILQNPQTYHNFTTLLEQTNKTVDEFLQEREELLKKIESQSFSPKLQSQIDKAFKELRYEDARELLDAFLEANVDKVKELINAHYIKALSYMEQIRYPEAREEFEKIAPNIDDVSILFDYAEIYYILDEYDISLKFQKKILNILDLENEDDRSFISMAYENIGAIWHRKGDYNQVVKYYTDALNLKMEVYGEIHPEVGTSFNNMGLLMHDIGEYEKSIGFYKKSLFILLKTLGEKNLRVSTTYSNIGMSLSENENFKEAKKYYQKSLDIIIYLYGDNYIEIAKIYNNLALTLKREKSYNKAIKYYQKALKLQITYLGKESYDVGITYNNIGSVFYARNEYDEAIYFYRKSLFVLDNIFPMGHSLINGIEGNLEKAKECLKK